MHTSGGNELAEGYLKTQSDDVIMKLQTLMYVGNNKHLNIPKVHQDLKALMHDKAEAIRDDVSGPSGPIAG